MNSLPGSAPTPCSGCWSVRSVPHSSCPHPRLTLRGLGVGCEEQRRPPWGCTSRMLSKSEGWDWLGKWMTSLRSFTAPGPLLWSWGWRGGTAVAGDSAASLQLPEPPPPQSYPEAPPYLIGVFHPGDPAVQAILLPVTFFWGHHQGGREGIPASDQAPKVWWTIQDPSNFALLLYEMLGLGPGSSTCLSRYTPPPPQNNSGPSAISPSHAWSLTLEAPLWPQLGLPQATTEHYCLDSGCSCWRGEGKKKMRDTSPLERTQNFRQLRGS